VDEDEDGDTALSLAAEQGDVYVLRLLLDHPCADPAAMMRTNSDGSTALMWSASEGLLEAMRLLLDHPSADPAEMMMRARYDGCTALMFAASEGHVAAVRLLLDHPSADPAVMTMHANTNGDIALIAAAFNGHVDALRLLLDHPSADAAAMVAVRNTEDGSALIAAAGFAAGQPADPPTCPCTPLLFLLRRVAVESQPSDAHKAHMTKVMEVLCHGPRSNEMFGSDRPDDARDECICLLLERGARGYDSNSPVISRIIQECVQLARVPQLLNEAVVGVAIAREQDRKPRDNA
jgi:hypothetical protein